MLSNKVDATLGGFWNYEGVQLRLKKKKPSITRVDQAGVPTYSELVLVARQSTLTKDPQLVRRFAQALGRGYELVRRNPSKGVADLIAANPDLKKDAKLQTASVRATLPAFFPGGGKPWGFSNRGALAGLRAVDVQEQAGDAAAGRGGRGDQRVPRRAGRVARIRSEPSRSA